MVKESIVIYIYSEREKMKYLSYVFYGLAAIDLISANFFGVDFTGVVWSPIVLVAVGYIIDSVSTEE